MTDKVKTVPVVEPVDTIIADLTGAVDRLERTAEGHTQTANEASVFIASAKKEFKEFRVNVSKATIKAFKDMLQDMLGLVKYSASELKKAVADVRQTVKNTQKYQLEQEQEARRATRVAARIKGLTK